MSRVCVLTPQAQQNEVSMADETGLKTHRISARNQLSGTVEAVALGTITAKVTVRIAGGGVIESVITRESVEEMGIKVGQTVTAVIKSTEVMIMTS